MTIQKHNDEYGYKRGTGAYSQEDSAFTRPKHSYDMPGVKIKNPSNPGPAGDMLAGSASLPRGGPPRHAPKRGPISNAARPK